MLKSSQKSSQHQQMDQYDLANRYIEDWDLPHSAPARTKGNQENSPLEREAQAEGKKARDGGLRNAVGLDARLHVDDESTKLNRKAGSKAFTIGKDVYFDRKYYQPNQPKGRELIGHEVAHTVQQAGPVATPAVQFDVVRLQDLEGNDPMTVSSVDIQSTNEYKSLMNADNIWQWQVEVTAAEAERACRLMLRSINRGESINWSDDTRSYLFEARRQEARGLTPPAQGGGSLTSLIQTGNYEENLEKFGDWGWPAMVTAMTLLLGGQTYAELDAFLNDQPSIRNFFGPDADSLIDAAIGVQVQRIVDKYNKYHKETVAGKDPAGLSAWETETGVSVTNPYYAIPRAALEAVYRASLHTEQPPEVLLALWVKEGKPMQAKDMIDSGRNAGPTESGLDYDATLSSPLFNVTIDVNTAEEARSYVRSRVYYEQFGSDHFTAYKAVPDYDNIQDADLSQHDPALNAAMQEMKDKGYLRQDITVDMINAGLSVSPVAGGGFLVTGSPEFYALSIELNSAYFSYLQDKQYGQLDNGTPGTDLNYAQWNMGEDSFEENLLQYGVDQTGKTGSDLEDWVLHNAPPAPPAGQVRRNTIRFGMYRQAYKKLFE